MTLGITVAMTDSEFNECLEELFQQIEEVFDEQDTDVDAENSGGILTIEFENGSTIVLSRQIATHQLWMAARSGGYHFEFTNNQWQCTRTDRPFFRALTEECLQQAGVAIAFI
jgi:CyaY protein